MCTIIPTYVARKPFIYYVKDLLIFKRQFPNFSSYILAYFV